MSPKTDFRGCTHFVWLTQCGFLKKEKSGLKFNNGKYSLKKKKKSNKNLVFWLLWEVRRLNKLGQHSYTGTGGGSFLLLTTGLASPAPSYAWPMFPVGSQQDLKSWGKNRNPRTASELFLRELQHVLGRHMPPEAAQMYPSLQEVLILHLGPQEKTYRLLSLLPLPLWRRVLPRPASPAHSSMSSIFSAAPGTRRVWSVSSSLRMKLPWCFLAKI